MVNGLVFNVQKYSVQDGPGIRTTVFLKGCPLRCAWCHNPEGISSRQESLTIETRCIHCRQCVCACPHADDIESLQLSGQVQNCELCGACVEACPTGARQIMGAWMSVDEVLRTVLKDRLFYEDSGGGVTFSGGEPLMQPEFLREALKACRGQGIHTAVDTCGYAPRDELLATGPFADLFLYDLKFMDEAAHLKFTGRSNNRILDNLGALAEVHNAIWLRIPLIPKVNDAPEELSAIAQFASSLPAVQRVSVLPFHSNGTLKAARLGHTWRLPETQPPGPDALRNAVEIFRRAGLPVQAGG